MSAHQDLAYAIGVIEEVLDLTGLDSRARESLARAVLLIERALTSLRRRRKPPLVVTKRTRRP